MNSLISQINDQSKLVICSALAKDGKNLTSSQVKRTFKIHIVSLLMKVKIVRDGYWCVHCELALVLKVDTILS